MVPLPERQAREAGDDTDSPQRKLWVTNEKWSPSPRSGRHKIFPVANPPVRRNIAHGRKPINAVELLTQFPKPTPGRKLKIHAARCAGLARHSVHLTHSLHCGLLLRPPATRAATPALHPSTQPQKTVVLGTLGIGSSEMYRRFRLLQLLRIPFFYFGHRVLRLDLMASLAAIHSFRRRVRFGHR
jgi:hypothetical protein